MDNTRRNGRALAAVALIVGLGAVMDARPARAYLTIDWLSCRAEVVSNGEGGLRVTGREICNLVDYNPYGFIYRPTREFDPPQNRICQAKEKKADKALKEAKKRLTEKPACAAVVNGPQATGAATADAVINNQQYDACAGPHPPGKDIAAQAVPSTGTNTDIKFFDTFYGPLGGYDYLGQLNNDGLRRQMVALHELAHATGKVPADDAASEQALNQAILDNCFGIGDKGNPSNASVDPNGTGVYPDATTASTDANDGVLGDDGTGDPPDEDVFIADPDGTTTPPPDPPPGGGGGGGGGGYEELMY